jgi:RHS repeat-associated protein
MGMIKLRAEQYFALRKRFIGDELLRSWDPSGRTTLDSATGDVLTEDAAGNTTRMIFNRQGYIGGIESPLGRKWQIAVNPGGKPSGVTAPSGLSLGFQYDAGERMTGMSRNGKFITGMGYDEKDRLSVMSYPDQTSAHLYYDSESQVTGVRDRLGFRDQYLYQTPGGPLTAIRDGKGNQTSFDYSEWDRPDRTRFADGTWESYQYDPAGRVRRIAAESGATAQIEYDDADRPVRISHTDGEVLEFEYDRQGRVLKAANQTVTVRYEYDVEGRVVREDQGGEEFRYEYGVLGELAAIVDPSGSRIEYTYDADLRLTGVKDWNGGDYRISYGKDDRSLTTEAPNGLRTESGLTQAGLPAETIVRGREAEDGELFSFRYEFDQEDRLASFLDSGFAKRAYAYDAEGQLLSVECAGESFGESFAYDAAGNRARTGDEQATFGPVNQMLTQGATRCRYDARGSLAAMTTPSGEWRFFYNSRNLLVRAEERGVRVVRFWYDAFGRRVKKESGASQVRYQWSGEHMLREARREGAAAESFDDYLYLPDSWVPLAKRSGAAVYSYHADHMGTPRRMTDAQGRVVWSAEYRAFGDAIVRVQEVPNPLRFPGQYFDEETGLHYNRFRYYSPQLGRYLSRDPVTFLAGTNFYSYAGNNPVSVSDPMGLWPSWKTVACVVAAVAVGVVVAAAVVAAAPVVLAAVGATAAAAAVSAGTVCLATAAVTAVSVVVGGAAAGAFGYGLNEYLEHGFNLKCIFKEAARGAKIGAVAALPFAALPFAPLVLSAGAAAVATGTVGFAAAGGVSGAISYLGEIKTNPAAKFSWLGLGASVVAGAATAGLLRYGGGKISQIRAAKAVPKALPPEEPVATPKTEPEPAPETPAEEPTNDKAVEDPNRPTGEPEAVKPTPFPGGEYQGTEKPWTKGATPNSKYTQVDSQGRATQNAIYDENGDVIGHVDFKNHGQGAESGHGHVFPEPGNPASGHGPGKPHIPNSQLPSGWGSLPSGVQPKVPIGK